MIDIRYIIKELEKIENIHDIVIYDSQNFGFYYDYEIKYNDLIQTGTVFIDVLCCANNEYEFIEHYHEKIFKYYIDSERNEYYHPHISVSSSFLCLGEYSEIIEKTIMNIEKIEDMYLFTINIILNVLNSYNAYDKYYDIFTPINDEDDYDEDDDGYIGTCSECGTEIYEGYNYYHCHECNEILCEDCYYFCETCEEVYCSYHLKPCQICSQMVHCEILCWMCYSFMRKFLRILYRFVNFEGDDE